jgi:hypothetical protein
MHAGAVGYGRASARGRAYRATADKIEVAASAPLKPRVRMRGDTGKGWSADRFADAQARPRCHGDG